MLDPWHNLPRVHVMVCASVLTMSAGALAPSLARAAEPTADEPSPPTTAEIDDTLLRLKQVGQGSQLDPLSEEQRQWLADLLPPSGPVREETLVRIEALLAHPELGFEQCSLLAQWLHDAAQRDEFTRLRKTAVQTDEERQQVAVYLRLAELADDAQ